MVTRVNMRAYLERTATRARKHVLQQTEGGVAVRVCGKQDAPVASAGNSAASSQAQMVPLAMMKELVVIVLKE